MKITRLFCKNPNQINKKALDFFNDFKTKKFIEHHLPIIEMTNFIQNKNLPEPFSNPSFYESVLLKKFKENKIQKYLKQSQLLIILELFQKGIFKDIELLTVCINFIVKSGVIFQPDNLTKIVQISHQISSKLLLNLKSNSATNFHFDQAFFVSHFNGFPDDFKIEIKSHDNILITQRTSKRTFELRFYNSNDECNLVQIGYELFKFKSIDFVHFIDAVPFGIGDNIVDKLTHENSFTFKNHLKVNEMSVDQQNYIVIRDKKRQGDVQNSIINLVTSQQKFEIHLLGLKYDVFSNAMEDKMKTFQNGLKMAKLSNELFSQFDSFGNNSKTIKNTKVH